MICGNLGLQMGDLGCRIYFVEGEFQCFHECDFIQIQFVNQAKVGIPICSILPVFHLPNSNIRQFQPHPILAF